MATQKRKDGLVEKKITIGHTIDGKPIRKSFYAKSDREITRKIAEYHKNSNSAETDESVSLAKWAKKWLETYKKNTVIFILSNIDFERWDFEFTNACTSTGRIAARRASLKWGSI